MDSNGSTRARTALPPWLPPRSARLRATLSRADRDEVLPQRATAPVGRPVTVAVQVTLTGADAVTLGAEIADRFRALATGLASESGADASVDAALVLGGDSGLLGDTGPLGDRGLLGSRPAQAAEPTEPAARVRIVSAERTVLLDGEPVDFTRREFDLLRYLATEPGRVFTREQLLRAVWGYEHIGGERTVDVHVRRVRSKLGPHESVVKTVRGVGYRLAGPGLAEVVE